MMKRLRIRIQLKMQMSGLKILLATSNIHKYDEISEILEDIPYELVSLRTFDGISDVEEGDGSYYENAVLKACGYSKQTGLPAIADDTGLEIDFLGGAPGIRSARFFDEGMPYEIRNRRLLEMMKDAPEGKRGARFVCCAVIADGDRVIASFTGELKGSIAFEPDGGGGFGYDPVFLLEDGRTLASVAEGEKNSVSHRAEAMKKVAEYLKHNRI